MKKLILFVAALSAAFSVFSAEYYVDASQSDDSGIATNWVTAKQTIQAAVDLAVDGDTVWVTNGAYARIVVTNSVSIHSVNGHEETSINGEGARCVKLASGVLLDGFCITNGYASGGSSWHDGCGGGVFCDFPSTNTVIINCVIMGNRAKNSCAGVYGGMLNNCEICANRSQNTAGGSSGSTLNNCVISDNQSEWIGGGVYCCEVNNCIISNNYSAGWDGGGAYGSTLNRCVIVDNRTDATGGGASESTLNNCLVVGNQADFGGGVYKGSLINCTVTENIATNSTGDSSGGGAGFAILRNSIVFDNSADEHADYYYTDQDDFWGLDAQYSCFSEATHGFSGNINSDPEFVNASSGNYRIKSGSPCVNAGINEDVVGNSDLNGNTRIQNVYVDMGAYESEYNSPEQYIRDFFPTNGAVFLVTDTVYFSATGGGSWRPIIFDALPGCPVVWVNSTTMQFSAGGDIYITADQAGDFYYNAAESVTNHYIVPYTGEFYVDASQSDDYGVATDWATAKRTIKAALDLAANGSTIRVADGIYNLSEELLVTKTITIQSVHGPEETIVDGGGGSRCFNLSGECLVSGFTITNGFASGEYPYWHGGGVYCGDPMPIVSNCVIIGNSAGGYDFARGGGMYRGTAVDCIFSGNTALEGGGLSRGTASNCTFIGNFAEGSFPLLGNFTANGGGGMSGGKAVDCVFSNNAAESSGGGMFAGDAFNCIFVDNSSGWSGGGLSGTAFNCLIRRNSALLGGGGAFYSTLYNCTVIENSGGGVSGGTACNSIVWNNGESNYEPDSFVATNCCASNFSYGVSGNITNLPLFVDAANGDFRLMSNSPCINWGNNSVVSNATDLDGNARIVEEVVDIGAYEYQGILGLADSDGDGIPDDWERQHGGNQNPERTCSNGINKVRQAYIAGLDPNDPDSTFLMSVLRSPTSGSILQWTPSVSFSGPPICWKISNLWKQIFRGRQEGTPTPITQRAPKCSTKSMQGSMSSLV